MSWSKDRVGALLLLSFFATYGLLSQGIEVPSTQHSAMFTARSLPTALALIGLLGGLWLALRPTSHGDFNFAGLRWGIGAAFVVLMTAYGLTIRPLGFVLATLLFLTAGFVLLGERRPAALGVTAGSITAGFWILMHYGLGVYLAPWPSVWTD